MEIVLAYSGSKTPKYLEANLRYLKYTFPEQEITLLIDQPSIPTNLESYAKCLVVESDNSFLHSLFQNLEHDAKFWDGFWFRTIQRFFLLDAYLMKNPSKSILHIESDVLLLPNFPFDSFSDLDCDLAFPVLNENQGVASVMYIKNRDSIRKFLEFSVDYSLKDPYATDMTFLSHYARFSRKVAILPSIPPGLNPVPHGVTHYQKSLFSKESNFKGIFDGATLGQYLFGVDPRNNLGNRKLFLSFPHHFLNPNELNFQFHTSCGRTSITVGTSSGPQVPVYCLHIHSKDLRAFEIQRPDSDILIKSRVRAASQKKIVSEYVPHLFILEFPNFARALIHRLYSFLKSVILDK